MSPKTMIRNPVVAAVLGAVAVAAPIGILYVSASSPSAVAAQAMAEHGPASARA